MPHRAPRRRTRPDTGPRGPGTAQRICSSQLRGRSSSHRAGALAVLPRTMSSSWPRPTSTMLVAQALARNRPRRHVRVSSSPSAKTSEIRSVSASSSASPQRRTDVFTGCQLHPSSEATSWTGRPQPAWRVAQRPARAVSRSRTGAIAGSCSVTVPAGHPRRLQRHRRLCHACLTVGRPNAGRSTNSTARSPSDHNAPPHPPQPGLGARRRMWTRSGSPASSSTPSTSTSPSPTNSSHTRRVRFHRDPPDSRLPWRCRFWGIPHVQPRTLTLLTPTSNAKSQISWPGTRGLKSGSHLSSYQPHG